MRALVIDDSRAMRRIVSGILEGLGYEVQQAGHGREGLDVLDGGWLPELVCVDWNMPVMDGLQFVSAVRSNPAWRQLTIMMVTSESEHTQIVRALAAGARVVGTEIPVGRAEERFDAEGRLLDGEIFEQLRLHLTTLASEAVPVPDRVAA